MKYLKKSETIESFLNWNKEIKNFIWQIKDDDIETRKKAIMKKTYFKELSKLANENDINYDDVEIVSWMDNLAIMKIILESLKDKYNETTIIQELIMPKTNKRADFALFKDNKILIIEFSFTIWNESKRFKKKHKQVIKYKEELESILSKNIIIKTYTFLIEPEENDNYLEFPNNSKKIKNLIKYIIDFFEEKQRTALQELEYAYIISSMFKPN